MSERDTQKAILEYLAAQHILAFRMQVGGFASEYKGKQRFMRVGAPGMADILAFPQEFASEHGYICPLWIEVKSASGKQSELQKSFQAQVEAEGHKYIVARSIEDVEAAL